MGTKTEVRKCLFKLFLEGGAPQELLSDRGGEFLNLIPKHLCTLFRVHKIATSSYHPMANGQVEKMNSRIVTALTAWINLAQDDWDIGIGIVNFAIRTTPQSTTGLTPFFAMHCREAVLPSQSFMKL